MNIKTEKKSELKPISSSQISNSFIFDTRPDRIASFRKLVSEERAIEKIKEINIIDQKNNSITKLSTVAGRNKIQSLIDQKKYTATEYTLEDDLSNIENFLRKAEILKYKEFAERKDSDLAIYDNFKELYNGDFHLANFEINGYSFQLKKDRSVLIKTPYDLSYKDASFEQKGLFFKTCFGIDINTEDVASIEDLLKEKFNILCENILLKAYRTNKIIKKWIDAERVLFNSRQMREKKGRIITQQDKIISKDINFQVDLRAERLASFLRDRALDVIKEVKGTPKNMNMNDFIILNSDLSENEIKNNPELLDFYLNIEKLNITDKEGNVYCKTAPNIFDRGLIEFIGSFYKISLKNEEDRNIQKEYSRAVMVKRDRFREEKLQNTDQWNKMDMEDIVSSIRDAVGNIDVKIFGRDLGGNSPTLILLEVINKIQIEYNLFNNPDYIGGGAGLRYMKVNHKRELLSLLRKHSYFDKIDNDADLLKAVSEISASFQKEMKSLTTTDKRSYIDKDNNKMKGALRTYRAADIYFKYKGLLNTNVKSLELKVSESSRPINNFSPRNNGNDNYELPKPSSNHIDPHSNNDEGKLEGENEDEGFSYFTPLMKRDSNSEKFKSPKVDKIEHPNLDLKIDNLEEDDNYSICSIEDRDEQQDTNIDREFLRYNQEGSNRESNSKIKPVSSTRINNWLRR